MDNFNLNEVGNEYSALYHTELSEEFGDLFDRIAKMQAQLEPVPKSRTAKVHTKSGTQYAYAYADLSDCRAKLQPILAEHGLALFHTTEPNRITAGEIMLVTWLVFGNQWIRSYLPLGDLPSDAQRVGGRISYFKRYAECAITGLVVIDEDNEEDVRKATVEQKTGNALEEAKARHSKSISAVKHALHVGDLEKAAEAWYEIPYADASRLAIAPTKGGVFTTPERKLLYSPEFREAAQPGATEEHDAARRGA